MGCLEITSTVCSRIKQNLRPLLFGQLLSIILAAAGASNDSLHYECNLSAPTLQAGLIYFFLSISLIIFLREHGIRRVDHSHHVNIGNEGSSNSIEIDEDEDSSITHYQSNERISKLQELCHVSFYPFRSIKGSPFLYFVMALLDVEANYFTFLAYRYTSLTSVALIDAVAIPSSMLFSRLLLRRSYKITHFLGAIICITGVVVNVLIDYEDDKSNKYYEQDDDGGQIENNFPYQLQGDMLAFIGATIYGLNDVLTERAVKHIGGVKEYLSMLGLFGTLISLAQGIIVDRHAVTNFFTRDEDVCSATRGFGLLFASAFFGVLSYIGGCNFLAESEAAFYNLSLLTGDLWVVAFTVAVQSFIPSSQFWFALVLIFAGVILYEASGEPISVEIAYDDIRRNGLIRQRNEDSITAQHLSELEMPDEII